MKIVLCNGKFDPFHPGHLYHLQAAKRLGDTLIVSVTCDDSVRKEAGAHRPVFTEKQRMDVLRSLKCVDGVIVCKDALDALQLVKPAIFVKGSDYRGRIDSAHFIYCQKNGIEIRFTDELTYSSTKLLKHYESRRG